MTPARYGQIRRLRSQMIPEPHLIVSSNAYNTGFGRAIAVPVLDQAAAEEHGPTITWAVPGGIALLDQPVNVPASWLHDDVLAELAEADYGAVGLLITNLFGPA